MLSPQGSSHGVVTACPLAPIPEGARQASLAPSSAWPLSPVSPWTDPRVPEAGWRHGSHRQALRNTESIDGWIQTSWPCSEQTPAGRRGRPRLLLGSAQAWQCWGQRRLELIYLGLGRWEGGTISFVGLDFCLGAEEILDVGRRQGCRAGKGINTPKLHA